MIAKKDQKYILDVVGDEAVADHIISYLSRYKNCVSYEVFPIIEGESTKGVFHPLFNECWSTDRFLKLLPFFYTKLSLEDLPEYENWEFGVFEHFYGELSFEGILNELFEGCKQIIENEEGVPEQRLDYDSFDKMRSETLAIYERISDLTGKTCREILSYLFNQPNPWYAMYNLLDDWDSYVSLCEQFGETDFFPKQLVISLNTLKERAGESVKLICSGVPSAPERMANTYIFRFRYVPVIDGKPVKRWLGVRTYGKEDFKVTIDTNHENDCYPKESYKLTVELKPDSILEFFMRGEWWQIYSGPLNIDVDLSILRVRRKELKLTQRQVAEAIGVELRTYQKWENEDVYGIKGFFLIRLMKYLDFSLDDVVKEIESKLEEENG